VRPSSFFVGAGRRVPVMWVLAVDRPLVVDGGGAVLVGWMVIGVWVCLPYAKGRTTNDDDIVVVVVIHLRGRALRPCCAPVVVFRGCWSSCAGHVGASRQPPVGGRPWWCCVSGVGGNRRGGAAYRMQKDERRRHCCCCCHPSAWHGSEAVACARRRLSWALVIVCQSLPLLCVGAVVVRWSWPFAGRLTSFHGWGCLRWWRLRYVA